MRNKLFSLVLLAFFILGISIFVFPQNETSKQEKRELMINENINSIEDMDTLLKDQFYFRDLLNKEYYSFKINANNIIYSLLSNKEYKYLSSDLIDINDGYLSNDVLTYDKEKMEVTASKGYNINQLDLKYPNIKTYVYFPTSVEEILYTYDDSNSADLYKEEFLKQLNENITYSSLSLPAVDRYKQLFYKSDFHWNAYGAYDAYKDIVNMINKDFDIDEPREIEKEITYDYLWPGNQSSEIGGLGQKDQIIDLKLKDIGEYKYYKDNQEYEYGKEKKEYVINGNTSYYSDYDYYFGDNCLEKRFDFNNDKPNILIFSDSLSNVYQEWLASHFNTTIYIDLRSNDDSFNLDNYIEEYDIDIILISQRYNNLYFNGYMFIPLD